MASAKLMIPKRKPAFYSLTANIVIDGQTVRKYGRFDFDPNILKTRKQRDNAAIEAAMAFERSEQAKVEAEKNGQNKPFKVVAQEYIESGRSQLDPSVRLMGDYEIHKNKANTTRGKEIILKRICESSPFGELPISQVNKKECEKLLELLGQADARANKGYATLKPEGKKYKTLSCPKIAEHCSVRTESVERVFRGERTKLKTAEEIAAALHCDVEAMFEVELDHRPIARKTLKEYANFLRLVMKYAYDRYGVANDTKELTVRRARSRPVDCLHEDEIQAIFKVLPYCTRMEKVIVMTLLNTGVRRGELAGLTWEDVNFDECTVRIERSLLKLEQGYCLTTTKEDNIRDIDVAPEFMQFLKGYYIEWQQQRERMGSAWQHCLDGKRTAYHDSLRKLAGYNFLVCNDFGFPLNPDHYNKIVDRVAEKAGIQRSIHPHMFRHTFVSILLSNPDIGVATVAAEAGHAQPSTTLAIYTQIYHKRQDAIRSQMSQTLYAKKEPER